MKYDTLKKTALTGFLALALIATAVPAPRAEAATLGEVQAQIQSLLAQIRLLQLQLPGSTSMPASCSFFGIDLAIGRSGGDVVALQKFLISRGYVIPAGATGYFGVQTRAALASFQAAQGIAPAVGYFGPITRARVNLLCTPGPTPTPTPTPTPQPGLQGEATFSNFDLTNGDDTNLEEGQSNVGVVDVEFDVEDGDARINRIDLAFTPANNNDENDPWDVYETIALWDGSTRIATIDASNEDNWKENDPTNGTYLLRFSGLNWVVREDDTAAFTVKVGTQNNIDGANDGESWDIAVPDSGIRAVDADGASVFTGDVDDFSTIDIDESGTEDELTVTRSDEDPDASTLALKDDARSGFMKIFAFDIDTDDSVNDIEIRNLPVTVSVDSGNASDFIREARLVIDGTTYTQRTTASVGATSTITFEFDRDELVIDAGDRVTAVLEVDFKALSNANEGTRVTAAVDASDIDAEGADDLTGSQLSGSVTGETHELRTSGSTLEEESTSAVLKTNSDATLSDDEGSYEINFNVTAFDNDLYIPRSAARGTALGSAGVNYVIEDASSGGDVVTAGTVASVLDSDADVVGGFYRVAEGDTESFTLNVEYDPAARSFYRLQLYSINWNTTAAAPTEQQLATPAQNFQTTSLSISN